MKYSRSSLSAWTALLFSCLLGLETTAQNMYNHWHMGALGYLNFVNNNPTPLGGSRMSSNEACATISDDQGNLLFYTNGETIWNRQNIVMANGDSLDGSQNVTQGALIVPKPGSSTIYYVFTIAANRNDKGLRYSEVDISLDGGNGAVIAGRKNIPLLAGPVSDKLTATKHCNGTDYWVLIKRFRNNQFIAYQLTSAGITLPGITSAIGAVHDGFSPSAKGFMRFSPDGKKLALVQNNADISNVIQVFDFNRSTGQLSNVVSLPALGGEYGLTFSSDNSKLYIGSSVIAGVEYANTLVQYNFLAQNLVASRAIIVNKSNEFSQWGALSLAPDKKIYIGQRFWSRMHIINDPNNLGSDANYADGITELRNATFRLGLPNHIDFFFNEGPIADFDFQITCALEPVTFTDSSRTNISSYSWDFGDTSSSTNSSTLRNPMHLFSAPGTYQVTLTVDDGCGLTNSISKEVVVPPGFDVDLGVEDTVICFTDQLVLESNVVGNSYEWFSGTPGNWTPNGNTTNRQVVDVNNAGYFRLVVTQGLCQGEDEVFVDINNNIPEIILPSDLLFCVEQEVNLDAGNQGAAFLWTTGDTTQVITISTGGAYGVTVTERGCVNSAIFDVVMDNTPILEIIAPSQSICVDDTITLTTSYGTQTGLDLIWSNGQTRDEILVFGTAGTYTVSYTTPLGCDRIGTIELTEKCPDRFFVPTIFSPNGDGVNDFFKPLVRNVDKLEMYIYDRWGNELFRSFQLDAAWDGKFKGNYVPEGFYSFIIKWTNPEYNTFRIEKGVVYVID